MWARSLDWGVHDCVNAPKADRQLVKPVRRGSLPRDLTSNGLKWDRSREISIIWSRFHVAGQLNSEPRVIEKQRSLRKVNRMPGFWDFKKK